MYSSASPNGEGPADRSAGPFSADLRCCWGNRQSDEPPLVTLVVLVALVRRLGVGLVLLVTLVVLVALVRRLGVGLVLLVTLVVLGRRLVLLVGLVLVLALVVLGIGLVRGVGLVVVLGCLRLDRLVLHLHAVRVAERLALLHRARVGGVPAGDVRGRGGAPAMGERDPADRKHQSRREHGGHYLLRHMQPPRGKPSTGYRQSDPKSLRTKMYP